MKVSEMTYAQRRNLREQLGVTVEQIAEVCKVEKDAVRRWDTGVASRNQLAQDCYNAQLQAMVDQGAAVSA